MTVSPTAPGLPWTNLRGQPPAFEASPALVVTLQWVVDPCRAYRLFLVICPTQNASFCTTSSIILAHIQITRDLAASCYSFCALVSTGISFSFRMPDASFLFLTRLRHTHSRLQTASNSDASSMPVFQCDLTSYLNTSKSHLTFPLANGISARARKEPLASMRRGRSLSFVCTPGSKQKHGISSAQASFPEEAVGGG